MKNFQKVILLSLMFFVIGTSLSYAQRGNRGDKTNEERASKRSQKWQEQLNLNDSQTQSIETAILNRMNKMDAFEKGDGNKEGRKEVMTAFENEIKSILTPEQFAEYTEMKAEKKGKRRGKRNRTGNN